MAEGNPSPPSFSTGSVKPFLLPTSGKPELIIPETPDLILDELELNEALPGLKQNESTAILFDINNLFKNAELSGFRIDYGSLKQIFAGRCDLRYCAAYSALDNQDPGSALWKRYMNKHGYEVISKPLKRYTDRATKREVVKGNMDVELVLGAKDLSPGFEHIIIATCDGDFLPLIDNLKRGKLRKVSVMAVGHDKFPRYDRFLEERADHFYDLNRIKSFISYDGDNKQGSRNG